MALDSSPAFSLSFYLLVLMWTLTCMPRFMCGARGPLAIVGSLIPLCGPGLKFICQAYGKASFPAKPSPWPFSALYIQE